MHFDGKISDETFKKNKIKIFKNIIYEYLNKSCY